MASAAAVSRSVSSRLLVHCFPVSNNSRCSTQQPNKPNSYGPSFNNIGGGFYAMERTSTSIKVWFWPRNGPVPSDVQNGASNVNTDAWVSNNSLECVYQRF